MRHTQDWGYDPDGVYAVTYERNGQRVTERAAYEPKGWVMLDHTIGFVMDSEVVDIYQLSVVDFGPVPGGAKAAADLLRLIAEDSSDDREALCLFLAGQLDPTPPRIPEPGTYGVVEASCVHEEQRGPWVHGTDGNWHWLNRFGSSPDGWGDLVDPVLVREGIDG